MSSNFITMIIKMVQSMYFPGRVFPKHECIDCICRFCVGAIHELPLTDPPESPLLRGTKKDKLNPPIPPLTRGDVQ